MTECYPSQSPSGRSQIGFETHTLHPTKGAASAAVRTGACAPASTLSALFLFILFVTIAVTGKVQAQASQATGAATELSCLPGLVHYFGFDETESGSYLDYVTGKSVTCSGCPSSTASLFAGAQRFNGSSSGIDLNETENFQWGPNSSFTIEMWVQVGSTGSTNQVLIGRRATDSEMVWWLGMDPDGYAIFDMYDRKRNGMRIGETGVKLNDGKWHHIAIIRDGRINRNKLYVDGYTVADYEYTYQDNLETVSPVNIGYLNMDNLYRFNGSMDELMVYNRALTETEMRSRYNNGSGNYCGPALVVPNITSEPVTYAVSGQGYQYDVKATGMPQPMFSLVSGPAGMTIHAETGALRWIATDAGKYEVKVKATNSQGVAEQSFSIEVKKGMDEQVGMEHHWMLQETSGTRYKDFYTPYDAAATENSSNPAPVKGAVSGGQHFDGKDDGLNVDGSPNFNWRSDESFSIELWMRSDASTAGNRVFIGRQALDSPVHWWVGADGSGQAGFQMIDRSYEKVYAGKAGPKLNNGRWHQVVAVRDAGSGVSKIYVDGEKVAEGHHVFNSDFASRSPVNIGYLNSGNGYHYEGDLDEVKLFGRVLSDAEIRERYMVVYNALTEFLVFKGRYDGTAVLLDWETINEIDSENFEVERSEDQETFTTVGTVKASGTTSSIIPYTFADTTKLKEKAYYRLKMNRTNGTFAYSKTIEVRHNGPISSSFTIYPNPVVVGQEINIKVSNLKELEEVTFMVTDVSGKRVHYELVQTDEMGELSFKHPVEARMRPGIYNLSIISNSKTLNRKLVIAR